MCFSFFLLEVAVCSVVKPGYWMGFYFWLDLVATFSMISDIGWIWDAIMGTEGSSVSIAKTTQLTRAARASRAGTRAGRIIRLVRIVRLTRLVKLYKIAQEVKTSTAEAPNLELFRSYVTFRGSPNPVTMPQTELPAETFDEYDVSDSQSIDWSPLVPCHSSDGLISGTAIGISSRRTSTNYDCTRSSGAHSINVPAAEEPQLDREPTLDSDYQQIEESRVGVRLSEITTKRVILLVLGMIVVLPLFGSQMYIDENNSYKFGLTLLDRVSETDEFSLVWNDYIDQHKSLFIPIIFLEVSGRLSWQSMNPDDLRVSEQEITILDKTIGSRNYVSAT